MFDELHEECGVFGVYQVEEAASLTYYGLHALQHRGQEGCGIAVSDGRAVQSYKGRGLISEVVHGDEPGEASGNIAIGHVRYSTAGGNTAGKCTAAVVDLASRYACHGAQRPDRECASGCETRWRMPAASFREPVTVRSSCT